MQILQIIFIEILGSLTWLLAVLKKKKLKISLDNTEDYLNFRFIKLVFVQQCDYTKLANLHLL